MSKRNDGLGVFVYCCGVKSGLYFMRSATVVSLMWLWDNLGPRDPILCMTSSELLSCWVCAKLCVMSSIIMGLLCRKMAAVISARLWISWPRLFRKYSHLYNLSSKTYKDSQITYVKRWDHFCAIGGFCVKKQATFCDCASLEGVHLFGKQKDTFLHRQLETQQSFHDIFIKWLLFLFKNRKTRFFLLQLLRQLKINIYSANPVIDLYLFLFVHDVCCNGRTYQDFSPAVSLWV